VRFIDLGAVPTFFQRMESGFPPEVPPGLAMGGMPAPAARPQPLVVHDVGAFEASFVPRALDFDRLDARFRLPSQVWDALPAVRDWGFAVFKLKDAAPAGKAVHPMAFEFPRRATSEHGARLFFPTLHVHDGVVHPQARFDHVLYAQHAKPAGDSPASPEDRAAWRRSLEPAAAFMPPEAFALGVVHKGEPCWRLALEGLLPNADTYA
jgi:hypothetical protein